MKNASTQTVVLKHAIDELNEINNFNLWEQLSAHVSEYPFLFDKSNKEYHRKDEKEMNGLRSEKS